jgi:hypothetical protein
MSAIIANKKIGRSIEEVLVRRKFDSSNPETWPDGHPNGKTAKMTQSLPDLKPELQPPGTADNQTNTASHVKIVREISTATNGKPVLFRIPHTVILTLCAFFSSGTRTV